LEEILFGWGLRSSIAFCEWVSTFLTVKLSCLVEDLSNGKRLLREGNDE